MEGAKLSKEELTNLIFYGLKENNINIKSINSLVIESILDDYLKFCHHFQMAYVKGELDTFKRAACLLVAINRGRLSRDKRVNAAIAIDATYKMCEKPYRNVGENCDIPEKLEEVDFKKMCEDDFYDFAYISSKNMLTDLLVLGEGIPLHYSQSLELLYQIALEFKHRQDRKCTRTKEKDNENLLFQRDAELKPKTKLLDLFRRH